MREWRPVPTPTPHPLPVNPSYPTAHLHVVHRILAGTRHPNILPAAPEGRTLARVWTVIDAVLLTELGPLHNRSAFLEDRVHDWLLDKDGALRYYSRVAETDKEVDIVLDYETGAERDTRLAARRFDPMTGAPAAR